MENVTANVTSSCHILLGNQIPSNLSFDIHIVNIVMIFDLPVSHLWKLLKGKSYKNNLSASFIIYIIIIMNTPFKNSGFASSSVL